MVCVYRQESYAGLTLPFEIWAGLSSVTGKRVFIKPNLVSPQTKWDRCSTTRVEVVAAVVKYLLDAGAAQVLIGDCGFKNQWAATIASTGYDRLVSLSPKVSLVPLQDGENYHKFTLRRLPAGSYRSLFGAKFSDYLLESDVVINIPKLKVHSVAGITCAIKNMMGCMAQKGSMHPKGSAVILHKRLADLYELTRGMVDLVLVDGIWGQEYSEQCGVPRYSGVLIAATDQWEADVAAAKLMGIEPGRIPYLGYISSQFDRVKVPSDYIVLYERPLGGLGL